MTGPPPSPMAAGGGGLPALRPRPHIMVVVPGSESDQAKKGHWEGDGGSGSRLGHSTATRRVARRSWQARSTDGGVATNLVGACGERIGFLALVGVCEPHAARPPTATPSRSLISHRDRDGRLRPARDVEGSNRLTGRPRACSLSRPVGTTEPTMFAPTRPRGEREQDCGDREQRCRHQHGVEYASSLPGPLTSKATASTAGTRPSTSRPSRRSRDCIGADATPGAVLHPRAPMA